MSVSVTGRHHDWLSLTPRSIRSNGIQARYGREAEAECGGKRGWTGRKFPGVISLFHLCTSVPERKEDVHTGSVQACSLVNFPKDHSLLRKMAS